MSSQFMPGFEPRRIEVSGHTVSYVRGGRGPAVLLLHGFPETHIAWRKVAPRLASQFLVVVPDLPGYGASVGDDDSIDGSPEHFSKRVMSDALVRLMAALGQPRFAVIGHDRGARVAYRMALDHPEHVMALGVLDIIPTLDVAERLTYETARQMTNWFWLAQPRPLPEELLKASPRRYLRHIIDAWGGARAIEPDVFEEYVRVFANPKVIGSICQEYRASDTIDLAHDRTDRQNGCRILCPVLALWEARGFVEGFGDPLSIWRNWGDRVSGRALDAGHFLMEERPNETSELLLAFLTPNRSEPPPRPNRLANSWSPL
jgi:haloacetate dehalogenase